MPSHPWYNHKRWLIRRLQQLQSHPLCALCLAQGTVTAATVADHVTPHRGDYDLFWYGPLQSLCKHHHNKVKQSIEERGYDNSCDVDGRPLDPNHPSNSFK
jgi:5-methylcytosine-specific restriction endonuclease McrA